MLNAYLLNTLQFNRELCNDCIMCTTVCPHAVFARVNGTVHLAQPEKCMECGACQLNCPKDAIKVNSGVGCATAMMLAAVKGEKIATCGGECTTV